jgi:molybdenum cofactor cytidylyltransferase
MYNHGMSVSFIRAMRASRTSIIAFVGAGGKTTALFLLAKELSKNSPVVVAASSHFGEWQIAFADKHIVVESSGALNDLEYKLQGITLITGALDGDRTKPLDEDSLNKLNQFCKERSVPLLIEADGSRQKPLKAWAKHEPPIPPFVKHVVEVVGLTGLGRVLNEENVHRAEIFSKLGDLETGAIITPDALTRVLNHSEGGQKNIPVGARKTILLNQADTPKLQAIAHGMAHELLASFHSVIVSSAAQEKTYAVHEPVAGIILAAGEAKRFGKSKQVLDWKGEPFVHVVARKALEAGLSPVIVVTGANSEKVEAAVKDLHVTIVRNDEWNSGQASSIKEGIKKLAVSSAATAGGAIFLLADQPQITTSIIDALVEKYAEGLYPIVAPMVLDQRANPVLFDQVTFNDLLGIEGDVGGRAIFHKHPVEYLPWHDDRMLLDVDTPEQYQRLISDETL